MKVAWMLLGTLLTLAFVYAVQGELAAQQRGERPNGDELQIAVQQICPVTGQKLGEHGRPVKVVVGEHKEQVFLCCKGCARKQIDPAHWATIHANFARAQQICPVMKHKLPKNPKWTVVEGRVVYVCCPPCTRKVAADPKPYLEHLDRLYTASITGGGKVIR